MTRHSRNSGIVAGALALTLTLAAAPVFAQAMGQVRGKVVDEAGQPVPEAEIVMEFVGDVEVTVTFKANGRGEFVKSGLRTGTWQLQAVKGELIGRNNAVRISIANMTQLEPIVIKPPVVGGAATDTSGMTEEEVAARNKLMESLKAEFAAGDAMVDADPDGAIAKYMAVAAQVPECAVCYTRIGDANLKKKDEAAAEAAFLKAIEFDPKMPDPYSALAALYNRQKKFSEAAAMSAKAGSGDASAVLNQGIIHWNAGEYPEAKTQFERAVSLDPKLADAYFRLGMANVNLGQLPDAVKAFEEYLKLAPDGEHAEMTKGILKSIKGDAPPA